MLILNMQTTVAGIGFFTEQEIIPAALQDAFDNGNAITLWRMPRSNEKHLLICTEGVCQLDEITLEESKTGFVFAPFDNTQKKMFFRGNLIMTFHDGRIPQDQVPEPIFRKLRTDHSGNSVPRALVPVGDPGPNIHHDYLSLVRQSVEQIEAGTFEKVVPTRFADVPVTTSFDVHTVFNSMCDAYPHAMVSLVSSTTTGTWLGASPELIVSIDDQSRFRTVALAGTKRYQPGMDVKAVAWNEKEIEEQALVCRYIISCFKKIRVREYDEHGPRTSVAGNILHLKTEYMVDMTAINFPQLGSVMLKLLHPTSAVCGMPLEPARAFLKANEGYDRQFYTGFLGPVNFKNESHIYVNLRCMQVLPEKVRVYAGAGVTIDSIPEKEWEETELKMDTLLSIMK